MKNPPFPHVLIVLLRVPPWRNATTSK